MQTGIFPDPTWGINPSIFLTPQITDPQWGPNLACIPSHSATPQVENPGKKPSCRSLESATATMASEGFGSRNKDYVSSCYECMAINLEKNSGKVSAELSEH
jgi:hypothetical protein